MTTAARPSRSYTIHATIVITAKYATVWTVTAIMRIAVISDIHGNLTAFEAVVADLRIVSPDLIVHGGDLLGSGARQADVIDRLRDLEWPGVYGNTDEMLWAPDRLESYLESSGRQHMRRIVLPQIRATLAAIGPARLEWLRALPLQWVGHGLAVVHAAPDDVWRCPGPDASDDRLAALYGSLGCSRVVHGHIHRSYVRQLDAFTVANAGSVSLPYDGDPRAAYAVVDDDAITIRRVEYDIEREVRALFEARHPDAPWIAAMLRTGAYVPPPVE
jgi:putative phosphoesterase